VNVGLAASIIRVAAPADIESLVRRKPRGVFARRLWFLYEWLTGQKLDVPEATGRLRFVPVLDPARQVALKVGVPSGRHRVIDNLPGTSQFCPMVRWTTALRAASAKQWHVQIPGSLHPRARRTADPSSRRAFNAVKQSAPSFWPAERSPTCAPYAGPRRSGRRALAH